LQYYCITSKTESLFGGILTTLLQFGVRGL